MRSAFRLLSPLFPKYFGKKAAKLFLTPTKFPRPQWEKEILIGSTRSVTRDKYNYQVAGDAGPTVLFVHGWSGRGSQFGNYVKVLQEKGFRVVLFDGPAHFEGAGSTTDIKEFAGAI